MVKNIYHVSIKYRLDLTREKGKALTCLDLNILNTIYLCQAIENPGFYMVEVDYEKLIET